MSNLRELAKAATPGPWRRHCDCVLSTTSREVADCAIGRGAASITAMADAAYIAAANPTEMVAKLDEIDALKAEVARLRKELGAK